MLSDLQLCLKKLQMYGYSENQLLQMILHEKWLPRQDVTPQISALLSIVDGSNLGCGLRILPRGNFESQIYVLVGGGGERGGPSHWNLLDLKSCLNVVWWFDLEIYQIQQIMKEFLPLFLDIDCAMERHFEISSFLGHSSGSYLWKLGWLHLAD